MAGKRKRFDSRNFIVPTNLVDQPTPENQESGYSDPKGADTVENLRMMGARDFPQSLWIEPKDWGDVAAENDKYDMWPESTRKALGRFTNQSPTHECTCHSLTQGFEAATRVQYGMTETQGRKGNPCVSQLSIYAEANPRIRGGANCLTVLRIAMERGFLPEPIRGQDQIFEHTLHGTQGKGNEDNSSGPWVRLSDFPDGWEETGELLRPDEAVNPSSLEECVCLVLNKYVINVGRNGHAVPWNHVTWNRFDSRNPLSGLTMWYADSYDRILGDSLRTAQRAVSGSSSITRVTRCDIYEQWLRGG